MKNAAKATIQVATPSSIKLLPIKDPGSTEPTLSQPETILNLAPESIPEPNPVFYIISD